MDKQIVVINNVFEDNLLILKSKGKQNILRQDREIRGDFVEEYLTNNGIKWSECEIIELRKDFKGEYRTVRR